MSKSNKYGYSGVDIPTQAVKANVGKFDPKVKESYEDRDLGIKISKS